MDHFWSRCVTPVEISPPLWKWILGDRFFFIGSCFADYFAQSLESHFHPFSSSPFGQVYNPVSLARGLQILMNDTFDPRSELFFYKGFWRHPDFHTGLKDPEPDVLVQRLQECVAAAKKALRESRILVVTLGTSWAWEKVDTQRVWSNCHTLPQNEFHHRLLEYSQMLAELGGALDSVEGFNPNLKTVLTVSPIRHRAQGLQGNCLSKSLLRVLADALQSPRRWYFPAYEILMDEMRDYRWYSDDLLHPSQGAREYIFARFRDSLGTGDLKEYWRRAGALKELLNHRPSSSGAKGDQEHQQFLEQKIKELQDAFPFVQIPWQKGGPELN